MKKSKAKKHITEQKFPEQTKEFRDFIETLYQLHCDKNVEYGPNNVRFLGQLGIAMRMHEKSIRLLNLLGWDAWEGKPIEGNRTPKFGGVDEELKDIAALAVCAEILGKHKWAK